MNFRELVQTRRSVRKFTDKKLTNEEKQTILRAGLMAPTGHNERAWKFFTVEDSSTLLLLSKSKELSAEFLAGAAWAVVVAYDKSKATWIEDAAIAAVTMQYQATDLGIGSCWAQLRNRTTADGENSNDYLARILGFNSDFEVVCIIGFGYPAINRKLQDEEKLLWSAITEK